MLRKVGDSFVTERLIDLSREGAGLATQTVLRVGSAHRLRLTLPGLPADVSLEASVVHVRRSGRPGEYEAGLRFCGTDDADLKRAGRAAFATRSQARSGPRLEINTEASWSEGADKPSGVVELVNLGLGGALIRGEAVPSKGAPFVLGMRALAATETVAVPARVVWSRESGGEVTAGVAFINQADTRGLVAALLESFFWTLRPPPPTASHRPPEARIGRFEPGALLIRGRAHEVYRAKAPTPLVDASGAVEFALRRFFGEEGDVAVWSERFLSAAQIGAELFGVPGVLRVYGATSGREDCLLATEYFDGTSFDQSLALFARTADLPPLAPILGVISEVLQTLEQCHHQGLDGSREFVHGDLRPSNVLLGLGGEVKLTGFGCAPLRLEPRTVRAPPDRVAYLAPELFRDGGSPTRASDVYQCAVMLYEAVTGARPFRPTSEEHLLKLVAARPVPPARLNPEVPAALEALLAQALCLEPGARPTVGAFLERIKALAVGVPLSRQTDPTGILEKVVERASKTHQRLSPTPWDERPTDHLGTPAVGPPVPGLELWKPRRKELEIGQVLGRYRILGKVGQGGMAAVYLARPIGPTDSEKPLVLKTLLPERNTELVNIKLFLNEARVACVLNHPNIVQLHDFGVDQGLPYMALEYVEGRTLAQVATALHEHGRLFSAPLAARIIAESCKGLAYAHALADAKGHPLGIVHRDMSSRNILISYAGAVKVLDFGIAKFRGSSNLTQEGRVRGTVDYVSPEQFREETATGQVDIWAMGVNLYELLTGTLPFRRAEFSQTMFAITNQEPRPAHEVAPGCPLALSAVAHRALQKNTADRYPDGTAMFAQLERYQRDHPATQPDLAQLMESLFRAAPGTDRERLARLAVGSAERAQLVTRPEPAFRDPAGAEPPTEIARQVQLPAQAAEPPTEIARQLQLPAQAAEPPTDAAQPAHPRPSRRWGFWKAVIGAGALLLALGFVALPLPTRTEAPQLEPPPPLVDAGGPGESDASAAPAPLALAADAAVEVLPEPAPAPDAGERVEDQVVELSCNVPCWATSDGLVLGPLPKRLTGLAPGQHRLVFNARTRFGNAVKEALLTLRAGEATAVAMQFGTGLLSVSAPAKTAVFISGVRRGYTPVRSLTVIEGTHQLRVGSRRQAVTIVPGQTTTVRVP